MSLVGVHLQLLLLPLLLVLVWWHLSQQSLSWHVCASFCSSAVV
jgi:hypothetical protein